jgi:hypothetical protein
LGEEGGVSLTRGISWRSHCAEEIGCSCARRYEIMRLSRKKRTLKTVPFVGKHLRRKLYTCIHESQWSHSVRSFADKFQDSTTASIET